MGRLWRELWWLILLYGLFLSGYQAWHLWQKWMSPVGGKGPSQVVNILSGSSLLSVARSLEDQGLIRSRHGFMLLAWWCNATEKIRAGEYEFSPFQAPSEILSDLVSGRIVQHVIIIPEGYNLYQVAGLLERARLVPKEAFLEACQDPAFLKGLGIEAPCAEGYLFPDTYYLVRGLSAREVVSRLIGNFWQVWEAEGFEARAAEMEVGPHEVVTLASIVEKEAALAQERPVIAGIFWNRLRRDMPLQADPTVQYGLLAESGVESHRLRRAELLRVTPYNTYIRRGLPAGPIANPGRDTLRAVLSAPQTPYLYFVSKNDGTHHFSRTLAEHARAVALYQRNRRPAKPEAPTEEAGGPPGSGSTPEEPKASVPEVDKDTGTESPVSLHFLPPLAPLAVPLSPHS